MNTNLHMNEVLILFKCLYSFYTFAKCILQTIKQSKQSASKTALILSQNQLDISNQNNRTSRQGYRPRKQFTILVVFSHSCGAYERPSFKILAHRIFRDNERKLTLTEQKRFVFFRTGVLLLFTA